jgi:DNA polymerase-3 subunit alpha
LAHEKELLGFYITNHPLARYEKVLKSYSTCQTTELRNRRDGDEVLIGGIISKVKFTTTRRTSEKMAILTLEDLSGTVEVLVFPTTFQKSGALIKQDAIVFVQGRANLREEDAKIVANDVAAIESVRAKYTKTVVIDMVTAGLEAATLDKLKKVMSRYPGRVPVYLNFAKPGGERTMVAAGKNYAIDPHDGFLRDVEKILGRDAVSFKM